MIPSHYRLNNQPTSLSNVVLNSMDKDVEEEGGGLIDIPDPDYSPLMVRKTHQLSNHQNNLWGNASRYKGSLEDLVETEADMDIDMALSKATDSLCR